MKIREFPILIFLITFSLVSCGVRRYSTQAESSSPKSTIQNSRTPHAVNTPIITPSQILQSTATATSSPTLAYLPTPSPSFTPAPSENIKSAPLAIWTPGPEPGLITALGPIARANAIAVFSTDGKYIILVSERIRMWDVHTLQLVREFINPNPIFCDPANGVFNSDSRYFAVSMYQCEYEKLLPVHIFVWDTQTGTLLQDWAQEYGEMTNPIVGTRLVAADSLAFIPNSTRLAYANKNEVIIQDILGLQETIIFNLGQKFYASQISAREDGEFLYVLMVWSIFGDFYGYYKDVFGIQIWGLKTNDLRYTTIYPEVDMVPGENMELFGDKLVHRFFDDAKAELMNLSNGETKPFLFRSGWQWYSSDLRYLVSMRYIDFEETDQGIEIWKTDTWRNLYTFKPQFEKDWYYSKVSLVFSPDNTILAIVYFGHVVLWDINAIIK